MISFEVGNNTLEFTIGDNVIEVTLGGIAGIGFKRDKFVGDDVETEFECTYAPIEDSLDVFLNGVLQEINVDYVLSAGTIIFDVEPDDGWKIEARYSHGEQLVFASRTPEYDKFAGDGLTILFALTATRISNTLSVYIDGIMKELGVDYTETGSGASITFASAPYSGAVIEARYETST